MTYRFNAEDMADGEQKGLSAAMLDRLRLDGARLEAIAKRTGHSQSHLALAWALHQQGIDTVLVGGRTPAHLDQAFAAETPFKGCIAHGMLTAGFISAAIATGLPGPGSVYVGQELRFDRPVRAGDTITVELVVQEKIPGKNHVVLKTVARNQNNKTVVSGTATVLPPPGKARVEQPAEPRFLPA
jgi:acyl dehydratase